MLSHDHAGLCVQFSRQPGLRYRQAAHLKNALSRTLSTPLPALSGWTVRAVARVGMVEARRCVGWPGVDSTPQMRIVRSCSAFRSSCLPTPPPELSDGGFRAWEDAPSSAAFFVAAGPSHRHRWAGLFVVRLPPAGAWEGSGVPRPRGSGSSCPLTAPCHACLVHESTKPPHPRRRDDP